MAAVIPKDTYATMAERFTEFNTFLFPLPRDQGYEFIVVQFLGNEAHFTTLINYQVGPTDGDDPEFIIVFRLTRRTLPSV